MCGRECEGRTQDRCIDVGEACASGSSHLHPTSHFFTHITLSHTTRYRDINQLELMLRHQNHSVDVLYYEVLDIPLPQLELLKTLRVCY